MTDNARNSDVIIGSPLAHITYDTPSNGSLAPRNTTSTEYMFFQTVDGTIKRNIFYSTQGEIAGSSGAL